MGGRQFRVLLRLFLFRVVDVDLLSSEADPERLLGQIAGGLLGVSFLVTVPLLFLGGGRLPEGIADIFAHFFVASTMMVVGLFAVLSWDEVFPTQRDVLVLSSLPVPTRMIFGAKMAALGVGLAVAVGALNGISGLLWPWLFAPSGSGFAGPFRAMGSFWLTLLMATVFVFAATLTAQGLASSVLPRRVFLRVSAVMQVAFFGVLVSVYVLEPSLESTTALHLATNHRLLEWLPTYWFWGCSSNGTARRMEFPK